LVVAGLVENDGEVEDGSGIVGTKSEGVLVGVGCFGRLIGIAEDGAEISPERWAVGGGLDGAAVELGGRVPIGETGLKAVDAPCGPECDEAEEDVSQGRLLRGDEGDEGDGGSNGGDVAEALGHALVKEDEAAEGSQRDR
jgi:hypothetical protein